MRQRLPVGALSSHGLVLAAAMTAIVLTATEGSIVATAMPTIVGHLGGFHLFSWAFYRLRADPGSVHPLVLLKKLVMTL